MCGSIHVHVCIYTHTSLSVACGIDPHVHKLVLRLLRLHCLISCCFKKNQRIGELSENVIIALGTALPQPYFSEVSFTNQGVAGGMGHF